MNALNTLSPIDPILSIKQVCAAVGYSPSQIYRLLADGAFPDRIRLGPGRVGWRTSQIVGWLDSRPSGLSAPCAAKHSRKAEDATPMTPDFVSAPKKSSHH